MPESLGLSPRSDGAVTSLLLQTVRLHPILECLVLKSIDTNFRLDQDLALAQSLPRILRNRTVGGAPQLQCLAQFGQRLCAVQIHLVGGDPLQYEPVRRQELLLPHREFILDIYGLLA